MCGFEVEATLIEISDLCNSLCIIFSNSNDDDGTELRAMGSNLRRDNIVKKITKINILSTVLQRRLRLGLVWGGSVSTSGGSMIGYYFVRYRTEDSLPIV